MIAVTGGAGAMGRRLCGRLLAQGERVRAIGLPDPESRATLERMGVEFFPADIRDPSALRSAFAGATGVVHLAAVVLARRDPTLFERVNIEGTRHVLAAAEAAGARRLVHISSISVKYRHQNGYSLSKRHAEEIVRGSRLDWTIVRPTLAWGDPMAAEYAAFARTVARWPLLPLPGGGKAVKRPVHLDDLVGAFAAILRSRSHSGAELDLPGPERITLAEMARRVRADRRVRGWTLAVPGKPSALLVRVLAWWSLQRGREPIADWQTWTGLSEDAAPDPSPALSRLGWKPRPFDPAADGLPRGRGA